MEHQKVVIVGDQAVGKTSLLSSFVNGEFCAEHIPTVFDTMNKTVIDGSTSTVLTLWDTAGQEEFKRLRVLSYVGANCFVICYSIDAPESLKNVLDVWLPEVRKTNPKALLILVGTKCDARSSSAFAIPTKAGRKMQTKIGAAAFLECSALTNTNVQEVFVEVARTIDKSVKKRCCSIS